jgi:2-polyprenyl-3-methyl-5-hydroxy-6-metoxy-1,4-benzoquinol methylase
MARYRAILDALDAVLAARTLVPRSILDIGCATGTFTAMLARRLAGERTEIRGIDVAGLAVARARQRYPDLRFDCLTVDECAARCAASMDMVTMLEVLYYVPERERPALLKRVGGMLRPGGVLVASSMIAGRPYLSPTELRELVGAELEILDSGVLYLKPLAMLEKLALHMVRLLAWRRSRGGRWRAPALHADPMTVLRMARLAQRFLGRRAESHSYVVAVRGSGGRP